MIKNKRKSLRRQIRYTAWLVLDGDQLHGCVLSDASDSGACIEIEDSKIVPDAFMLLLARNGSAQRKCHVVWRKPHLVGVKFERQLAHSGQATPVPVVNAETDATQIKSAATA